MSTSKRKLFTQIPVISHNSEKPSIASEEMSSGKIFPSLHNYLSTKKKEEINSNNFSLLFINNLILIFYI